jgi:hypothetical protein
MQQALSSLAHGCTLSATKTKQWQEKDKLVDRDPVNLGF